MKQEEFTKFIEEQVLPELESFATTINNSVIISWRTDYPSETLINSQLDTDVNVLRIFFTRRGNKVANVNLPQLIFGLNPNGALTISNSYQSNKKPEVQKTTFNIEEIRPAHIYGFFQNQIDGQE